MQLAILHHHLNRGGVTQVIQNHLRALAHEETSQQPERVALLYGGRRQDWPDPLFSQPPPFPIELVEIPRLDYDTSPAAHPQKLAEEIREPLLQRGFSCEQTILHCHNHALGKNASLPGALCRLAQEGFGLLLQIHDFAEDFRPANYRHLADALSTNNSSRLAEQLYPQGTRIHYAVLTERDGALLKRAGIPGERLHRLPNPVADFQNLPPRERARPTVERALNMAAEDRLVVYPVRGIRRKNLGEMLLLSAMEPKKTTYAVTLAPLNRAERVQFDRWQSLAAELTLPCWFDVGGEGKLPYLDILAASDTLLTTSVAEGFGMVFLEAWLAGRPLVGRNLPEITADFLASGVRFPWCYDHLQVPLAWIGEDHFRREILSSYRSVCASYGVEPGSERALQRQVDAMTENGMVDFAFLPFTMQVAVIRRARDNPTAARQVLEREPPMDWEPSDFDGCRVREILASNAEAIRQHYSPKTAATQLTAVYRSVAASPQAGEMAPLSTGNSILQYFLNLQRLHPIRLE